MFRDARAFAKIYRIFAPEATAHFPHVRTRDERQTDDAGSQFLSSQNPSFPAFVLAFHANRHLRPPARMKSRFPPPVRSPRIPALPVRRSASMLGTPSPYCCD